MYQPWSTGRHLLQKFTVKGINYQCAFQVQKDEGSWLWWNWICMGDCFANPPAIVIDPQTQGIAFSAGALMGKTPEEYVRETMAKINVLLAAYYGGTIPVTDREKVEQLLQQMNVSTVSSIPQFVLDTEREWGNDVARNKWLAAETGYTGPFRDGLFGAWCNVNDWDVSILNAKYNAL